MQIKGLLFDKDGTLFDFRATWDAWAARMIGELADHDANLTAKVAQVVRFDLETCGFHVDSPFIAGTNAEVAEVVAAVLPNRSAVQIELFLEQRVGEATLAPAVDLSPFLTGLRGQGMRLGVMTNDSEFGARTQLDQTGVTHLFDFIAGFDSGFGAKPSPDPLLAFADQMALEPETVVMVGDSTHDLLAGRRAGMRTLGVLTGTALAEELAPLADAVLPDIGHIPEWLQQRG
ncbi:MAG: HAD family hydrolase [Thalassovita sp.]